jgi:ABC-type antimicrobial peptide transport system permease subunit
MTIGPILVLFITSLTALYPALKVRRLRPVEALASV